MIQMTIRMNVLPEKSKELWQTIALLIVSIRTEKGCRRCDFCQNLEDENELLILEEWDTQDNLKKHLKSGHFSVIRGMVGLLKKPYEMIFYNVFYPVGMEETYG
jgi:quinol monooxygenase YgiN